MRRVTIPRKSADLSFLLMSITHASEIERFDLTKCIYIFCIVTVLFHISGLYLGAKKKIPSLVYYLTVELKDCLIGL